MFDVSSTLFCINRRNIFSGYLIDLLKHRIDRDAIPRRDVENLPAQSWHRARQQVRIDNVFHERKVTRLQTISVNRWPAALQHRRDDERKDTAVLRRRILSRSKNI